MINFLTTILEMGKPELILVTCLESLTFIPTFNPTLPYPHFCIVRTHVIPKLKVLGIYLRAVSRRWLPFSPSYKSIVFIMMRQGMLCLYINTILIESTRFGWYGSVIEDKSHL